MKLILRADDVGYTSINALGTFKAIDEGLITSADLMLDCPGFEDAARFLRERPWISVGWHPHFWGRPVLPPEQVPSMVNEEGKFKWRKNRKLQQECVYEEVLAECRAQLDRTIEVLGRAPEYTQSAWGDSPFDRARMQACKEYGIAVGFYGHGEHDIMPEYADLDVYMPNQIEDGCYDACYDKNSDVRMTYDPVAYLKSHQEEFSRHNAVVTAWHPGYLDEYILAESSMQIARMQDIQALCGSELHDWIKDNGIELINLRDALYGTRTYQNHLRSIGSDLYVPA